MYNTLLFATDLLKGTHGFALQAKHLAEHFKAHLHLMHVIETPASEQYAAALGFAELAPPMTEMAELAINALGDELDVKPKHRYVTLGIAHKKIATQAKIINCELLLVGSHANYQFSHLLGSTANALAHSSPCSLLLLR